jgi:hypothetical protein
MSDVDNILNFFNSSARQDKPHSKKQLPTPDSAKRLKSAKKKNLGRHKDTELEEMFQRMKNMQANLAEKIENIAAKTGLSIDEVMNFITRNKQIPITEQKRIEEEVKAFSEKVWLIVGKDIVPQKYKTDSIKERRGKTLGSRKKWIPIH